MDFIGRKLTDRAALGLLFLFALPAFFGGLGVYEIPSGDETRVAGIAAEMYWEKDYLLPKLNETPFVEYPPLFYWCISAAYGIFGIHSFAANFPSALFALGCGVVVYALARRLRFPAWGALASAFMLLCCGQYLKMGRTCMVDIGLAFFVLLSVGSFAFAETAENWKKTALYTVLFGLTMGGGVMTKGLLGAVLPLAACGSFAFLRDVGRNRVDFPCYFRMAAALLLAAGVAGIWYLLVYRQYGEALFSTALFGNNTGRFSGAQGDHVKPVYFYFTRIPGLFLPWLPFLFYALFRAVKRLAQTTELRVLFLLCFLTFPFLLLCLAAPKREVYLLPLYAPCALLCGWCVCEWKLKTLENVTAFLTRYRWLWAGIALAGMIGAAVVGRNMIFVIFALIAAGLTGLLRFAIFSSYMRTAAVFLLMGILVASGETLLSWKEASEKSLRPLFEECGRLEKQGNRIFLWHGSERTNGAAYFYLHHNLPVMDSLGKKPSPGEYWVLRARETHLNGRRFGDHHYLIGGAEKSI